MIKSAENGNDTRSSSENLQIIRGVPISTMYERETVEAAMDLMPADGDIIVSSYPKTGTTWMQYILLQILTKGQSLPSFDTLMKEVVPMIEITGPAGVERLPKPRVYKHHFRYDLVKKNPKSKIIYTYRRPEDTFLSSYYFMNFTGNLVLDDYFERYIAGNVTRGQYFEHILSYWKHKDDGNILFVSYEKLKTSRRQEILRITQFLGGDYCNVLMREEEILARILENTSFEYIKANIPVLYPKDPERTTHSKEAPMTEINFFRKGVIGDGRNYLNANQLQRLEQVAKEILAGTGIIKEWYSD